MNDKERSFLSKRNVHRCITKNVCKSARISEDVRNFFYNLSER